MLVQRILTALVLVPLAALAVFKLPSDYFSLLWGAVILLASWEWMKLSGISKLSVKILFLAAMAVMMLGVHFWTVILELLAYLSNTPEVKKQSGLIEYAVILPVFWWILAMMLLRKSPEALLKIDIKKRYLLLLGFFILTAAWMCLARLRAFYTPEMTMYFLALIWVADTTAYFAGKKYGKNKLAPEISPGKTVEGMYGALIATALFAFITLKLIAEWNILFVSDYLLLSLVTVLVSIYGDLFISLLKRRVGLKDTGVILPGHGGILDRVDGLIAAAPIFYAGNYLIYSMVYGVV
ncbi:MAG: phosphatidate cytidylyltransferase [Gammaproteobacteria bacterium]